MFTRVTPLRRNADGHGGCVFNHKTRQCAVWRDDAGQRMSHEEYRRRKREEAIRRAEEEERERMRFSFGSETAGMLLRAAAPIEHHVYLYHNKKAPPVLLFARFQYTAANCNTPVADAKSPAFLRAFYVRIQPLSDAELYSAMTFRAAGTIWAGTAAGFARK